MSEETVNPKTVESASHSAENPETVRKPVQATPQQGSQPNPEGDRSPTRQERDAPEPAKSNQPTSATPHTSETVRKPVTSKSQPIESASKDDRSPTRQERDARKTQHSKPFE